MKDIEKRIQKLGKKFQEAREEKIILQGRRESLVDELKEKYNISAEKINDEYMEALEDEIKNLKKKLLEKLDDIEKIFSEERQ